VAENYRYKIICDPVHGDIGLSEALLRHILFLLREKGAIVSDGKQIEQMVRGDDFLDFHDGYVDKKIDAYSSRQTPQNIVFLCKSLRDRRPPKLIHEVATLSDRNHPAEPGYALFISDRVNKIKALKKKHDIDSWKIIWEDPKDLHFEETVADRRKVID